MCNFIIQKQNRKCKRSPNLEYCYQHQTQNISLYEEEEEKEEKKEEEKEDCAICFSECNEKTICGHVVHLECNKNWDNKCPICRKENIFPSNQIKRQTRNTEENNNFPNIYIDNIYINNFLDIPIREEFIFELLNFILY